MSETAPSRLPRWRRPLPRWLRRLLLLTAWVMTLGLTFGLGVWGTLRIAVRVPEITMPDVSGLDVVDAQLRLQRLGLFPEISARRNDPNRPADRVLEQFPRAGARTKAGRPVRLVISLGPPKSIVPDLAGGSLGHAQLALRNAGLKVERQASVYHQEVSMGRVVAQHPLPSVTGFPGDGVTLLLSEGPKPRAYVMPDLAGKPAGQALADFRDCGFRDVVTEGWTGADTSGAVVAGQSPEPGSRVTSTDRVALHLRGRGGR